MSTSAWLKELLYSFKASEIISFGAVAIAFLMYVRARKSEEFSKRSADAAMSSAEASKKSAEIASKALDFEQDKFVEQQKEARKAIISESIRDICCNQNEGGKSVMLHFISCREKHSLNRKELGELIRGVAREGIPARNPEQYEKEMLGLIDARDEKDKKE